MNSFLSPRFAAAVELATRAHAGQVRKGTAIPYIAHPLAVAALVLEHRGNEDQAIAGVLHDVIEDGSAEHAEEIGSRFGPVVLELVQACTDGTATEKASVARDPASKKADWKRRKDAYLIHLGSIPAPALLVSACDKLHNVRAIVADVEALGPCVFDRFTAGQDGTLWYYSQIQSIMRERSSPVSSALSGPWTE